MRSMWRQMTLLAAAVWLASCGLATSNAERMEAAHASIAEGEYRAAVIQLRSVLVSDPDNAEARLTLANVLLGLNDLETAEKELERATELNAPPLEIERMHMRLLAARGDFTELLAALARDELVLPHSEVLSLKGEALNGLRNGPAAERVYREWLQLEPGSADASVGLAKARALQGEPDEAITLLEEVVAADSEHSNAWLALANIRYGLHDYEQAAADYRRSIASGQPEAQQMRHVFALLGLSDCELLLGDAAAARKTVTELSQYAPGLAETVLQRARVLQLEGAYAAAGRELVKLLNENPNDERIMMLLATIQWRSGNIFQAQEYLNRIVTLAPQNVRARKMLGQIELQQRNPSLALEMLEPLLEENSADSELLGLLAIADIQRGESNLALGRLRAAAELDSGNAQAAIQLAEGYVRTGQPEKAVEILADRPLSPREPYARERVLLAAYRDLGREEEALAEADRLLAAYGENIRALELVARFYLSLEKFDEARTLLTRSLELVPNNVPSRLMLAQLDLSQSRHAEASKNFQSVFDADSRNLTASLGLIQVAFEKGERDRARDLLERTFVQHPGESLPALVLANVYLEDGRRADAANVAASIADADVRDLSVVRSVGRIFFDAGDFERAREQFEIAIERSPRSVVLMLDLTRTLMRQRKYADAVSLTERIIELDPSSIPARVLQVLSLIPLGQLDIAEQRAMSLEESYPEDPSVALALGEVLAARRDYARAAAAFRTAAAKGAGLNAVVREVQVRIAAGGDPAPESALQDWIARNNNDVEARKVLAELYQRQGKRDEAQRAYVSLAEEYPEDPVIQNNLAVELQFAGDLERALKHAQIARSLRPQSGSIADTLGWIYRGLGDYANGVKHLREAARLSPGNETITYHLAATLADAGADAEARELLAELLRRETQFQLRGEAEKLLAQL